jgi:hypothetical protein
MVKGKRKFQENAVQPDPISYGKDAIDRLIELTLHLDLRTHEAKRLGLPKVRLDMMEMQTAQVLLDLLRRVTHGSHR